MGNELSHRPGYVNASEQGKAPYLRPQLAPRDQIPVDIVEELVAMGFSRDQVTEKIIYASAMSIEINISNIIRLLVERTPFEAFSRSPPSRVHANQPLAQQAPPPPPPPPPRASNPFASYAPTRFESPPPYTPTSVSRTNSSTNSNEVGGYVPVVDRTVSATAPAVNVAEQTGKEKRRGGGNRNYVPPVFDLTSEETTKKENIPEELLCKICFEREMNVAFFFCGHLGVCTKCAKDLEKCPFCREPIQKRIRVYKV